MTNLREVAIVGVGMTKFGSRPDKTNIELFSEAAMDALNESNLKPKDIQALYLGVVFGGFEESETNMAPKVAAEIGAAGIPATRFEGACCSSSVALRDAFIWVASGFYDTVLVGGTEKAYSMGTPLATKAFATATGAHYEGGAGMTFPGVFAMMALLYAKKYGIPLEKLKEQMHTVRIKNQENGSLNPKAHLQWSIRSRMEKDAAKAKEKGQPVTWANEIEYMKDLAYNRYVTWPLQLYDCCPFSDGGAALVVTSLEKAKHLTDKPVIIAGVGQSSAGDLYTQKDITRISAREISGKQAYDMAGLGPKDVDLIEIHDCFTIAEIAATESLGFFDFGKGSEAVEKGRTKIGGKPVVNPSGGLMSKGHPIGATGAAQAYEVVEQLRGESGPRQVDGAKVGMTDTLGGDLGTICNIILKRGW
jgi:acetyl-CoA C-acetyltransferase/acetyl-CoA acyltransferase